MSFSKRAPFRYKTYPVPKPKGGMRLIMHPAPIVKAVQRAILQRYIYTQWDQCSDVAIAYRKNRGVQILTHVKEHARYRHSLRLDIRDFFPSISVQVAENCGLFLNVDQLAKRFLTQYLFASYPTRQFALAIGAPTSPAVSNAVLSSFDSQLQSIAGALFGGNYHLTRYADDVIISHDDRDILLQFENQAEDSLQASFQGRLRFNHEKRVLTGRGGRRRLLGLVIGDDGSVGIGRVAYRDFCAQVYKFICYNREGLFEDEESLAKSRNRLRGQLAYVRSVDAVAADRVLLKYGDALLALLDSR